MSKFQIYFTESRICELFPGGLEQAHEWITGYFEEFPIKKFKIEIDWEDLDAWRAGFYVFIEDGEIECKLSNAIQFANRIVKVFNGLVADGDNRFDFADAKISII